MITINIDFSGGTGQQQSVQLDGAGCNGKRTAVTLNLPIPYNTKSPRNAEENTEAEAARSSDLNLQKPVSEDPNLPNAPIKDVKPFRFGRIAHFPAEVELVSHFQTHSDGTVSTYYPPLSPDFGVGQMSPPSGFESQPCEDCVVQINKKDTTETAAKSGTKEMPGKIAGFKSSPITPKTGNISEISSPSIATVPHTALEGSDAGSGPDKAGEEEAMGKAVELGGGPEKTMTESIQRASSFESIESDRADEAEGSDEGRAPGVADGEEAEDMEEGYTADPLSPGENEADDDE